MLKNTEIDFLIKKQNISKKAENVINQVRISQPSRRVQSGRGSMSGRFPSRKMGVTIQFESHKNELAYIYELEHDANVLEYYDQPPSIPLKYKTVNGRNIGFNHTPDFFVLGEDWAGWVECKTEDQLLKLAVTQPNRFRVDESGNWQCPPGESYAAQFGLSYRVWSSKDINRTYQRNIEYLEDYFRSDNEHRVNDSTCKIILSQIENKLGIPLIELYENLEGQATRDDILMLIAYEEIFVDLYENPLGEARFVKVFLNNEAAQAYSNIYRVDLPPFESSIQVQIVEVEVGKQVSWDGKIWRIANLGATSVTLVDDFGSSDIPIHIFEELVCIGKITGSSISPFSEDKQEVVKQLQNASAKHLAEANRRQKAVLAYLEETELPFEIPERTINRWVSRYHWAEKTWGYGYLGLLPEQRTGNSSDKLPEESRKLIQTFISESYESLKQKKKNVVYGEYQLACQARGLEPASYKTFIKEVKKRPKFEQTLKRRGRRAAYQKQFFYWRLDRETPRHGEHPFHIIHIDYTEIDLELVDSYTGKKMGKAWLGLAISASTRRILAVYLSFDAPSRSSDMMLIREIIRRHGRMPQIIVVDGGINFESTYFETLLAFFECTKKTRPAAEPRFGSIIERIFGTANTQFFHNLQGNTQIMKLVRQVTKSVHPKNHAVWTLPKLWDYLCVYCYEIYDKAEHPALGQSPREAFELQKQLHGQRSHRLIPYDENLKLLTLPTTQKGTAKVVPTLGVKINYIYYWSDAFSHPEVENTTVDIRFDPFNVGRAYAYARGQWVECYSEHHNVFNGRSANLLKLATAEIRQRKKLHAKQFSILATDIACFVQSAEAEELLLQQQLADNQQKYILQSINNEPISIFKAISSNPVTVDNYSLSSTNVTNELSIVNHSTSLETYKTFEEVFDV
ncbi:MAG: Mu transposase C-terminal domain-containing protein [Pyrinomonadaceae bacterium]